MKVSNMKPQIAFHFTAETIIKIASQSELFKQCAMERIPELFQPPFKVGDWLFKTMYIEQPIRICRVDESNIGPINHHSNIYRPATEEEILKELTGQFWSKFQIGDKIECVQEDTQHILTGKETLQYTRSRNVPQELLVLGLDGKFLMYVYESHFIAHTDTWSGLVDYTLLEYKEAISKLFAHRDQAIETGSEIDKQTDGWMRIIEKFEKRNNLK